MRAKTAAELSEILSFVDKAKRQPVLADTSATTLANATGSSISEARGMQEKFGLSRAVHYQASLNYRKLGIMTAATAVKSAHPRYDSEITELIARKPFVHQVVQITGSEATHFVRARFPHDHHSMRRWITELQQSLGDKVEWTTTMPAHMYLIDENYVYTREYPADVMTETPMPQVDRKDWEILAVLREEAGRTLAEIAEITSLSQPTVHRRIKRLEAEGVITGYQLIRSWSHIPLSLWPVLAVFMIRGKAEAFNTLIEKFEKPAKGLRCNYLYVVYGATDLVAQITAPNLPTVRDFLNDQLSSSAGLQNVQPYFVVNMRTRNSIADIAAQQSAKEAQKLETNARRMA